MPTRTRIRKRKPKRRKPSLRKKARRRRPASRLRVNAPSSDEDFVPDDDGEGTSSGFTDKEDTEEEEASDEEDGETEDEEENFRNEVGNSDANVGFSARRRRRPSRPDNGPMNARLLSLLDSNGTGGNANRASRVRRRNRRQNSSDEDFEVDMGNGSFVTEGGVISRPMTRAMDSYQVSDLHEGERGNFLSDSFNYESRGFAGSLDALQPGAGETSLQIRTSEEALAGCTDVSYAEIDRRKGKERALEGEESIANAADDETAAVVCGICWTEMVAVERGKLDSCNHFFCFGCIMEWAKVESRCPMCKQRFTTIARPGTGISKRARAIRIPLRNQVYIPPEDPDLPAEDPYADIVCMECQGTGDEGLLLLCDRCDSAAHTFCVGLGRSVPRGDWYCRDCQALTGGMSGSEDEEEELLFASTDEDEEEEDDYDECEGDDSESLLRSIVASVNPGRQCLRQATVQISSTSTSSSLLLPRNVRGRIRQQLSRRQSGRHIGAPRLSQAARAVLLTTSSELNQAPCTTEGGSARTVPQQRRLHERINEMRNNWGRIQNGDLHFDALRTEATEPIQQAVSTNLNAAAVRTEAREPIQLAGSSNSSVAPLPAKPSVMSSVSNKRDGNSVERPESSIQGEKDLERAWRMMGHAQNLSAGIGSSKLHQQKSGASSSFFGLACVRQPTENTARVTGSATSNCGFARMDLEMPTSKVLSSPLENGNAGPYKPGSTPLQVSSNLKLDEVPSRQVPRPTAPSASTEDCRKEDLPSSSNSWQMLAVCKSPIGLDKDAARSADGTSTSSTRGSKPELCKSGRGFESKNAGIMQSLTENTRTKDKRDIFATRENIVAGSSSSLPHEGLKVHLIELVKRQTWPVYITERLDKEQFKRIARAAVHSLLALCGPKDQSMSLTCPHFEDQGRDPFVKCCKKCLDQHVEKAVNNAKDKIIPS